MGAAAQLFPGRRRSRTSGSRLASLPRRDTRRARPGGGDSDDGDRARRLPPRRTRPSAAERARGRQWLCGDRRRQRASRDGMDLEASKTAIGSRTFWKSQLPAPAWRGTRSACATVLMVDGDRYVACRHRAGPAASRLCRGGDAAGAGECGRGSMGRPDRAPCQRCGPTLYERMGYARILTQLLMEKRFEQIDRSCCFAPSACSPAQSRRRPRPRRGRVELRELVLTCRPRRSQEDRPRVERRD